MDELSASEPRSVTSIESESSSEQPAVEEDVVELAGGIEVNVARAAQCIANICTQIASTRYRLERFGYLASRDESDESKQARESIGAAFRGVADRYLDQSGWPNYEAVERAARTVAHHIQVVGIGDMQAAAQRLVAEAPGDTIYLYLDGDKVRDADWDAPESNSSNEFTAKLVMRYAAESNPKRHVQRITDPKMIEGHEDQLVGIDDILYTGAQAGTHILTMQSGLKRPATFRLYSAGATEAGIETVYADAALTGKLSVQCINLIGIDTLAIALRDEPELLQLFLVSELSQLLDEDQDALKTSPIKALDYAASIVHRKTLTITGVRVPDAKSFPEELAPAINRPGRDRVYPSINTLQFATNSEENL